MKACPHCHEEMGVTEAVDGSEDRPVAGNASFCGECGKWSVYMDGESTRLPTDDEAKEFANDPEFLSVQSIWKIMKGMSQ